MRPSNRIMKAVLVTVAIGIAAATGAGCTDTNAEVASANLSKEADQFRIERRIVFFNGITDTYLLTIEGRCSIKSDNVDQQLEVTCKTGSDEFKKHFLGLSDNVTYFVEQTEAVDVDEYHYEVVFKPETIIPDLTR